MPEVGVHLPDDLYREARARDLPLSELAQEAEEQAIRTAGQAEWIERMRVALAEERGCALVTTDPRPARADPPCDVVAPG